MPPSAVIVIKKKPFLQYHEYGDRQQSVRAISVVREVARVIFSSTVKNVSVSQPEGLQYDIENKKTRSNILIMTSIFSNRLTPLQIQHTYPGLYIKIQTES